MASPQQSNTNFDPPDSLSVAHKEHGEKEVPISYGLRDREMLRKRKQKAEEKNSAHWIYREPKIKKQRKARGDKKTTSNQPVVKPKPAAEPKAEVEVESQAESSKEPVEQLVEELDDVQPKPKPQEKAEPVAPEPVEQEQLPVLTTQDLSVEIPVGGNEELLNLTEAEIPDNLNASLDSLCQDNEHIPFLF